MVTFLIVCYIGIAVLDLALTIDLRWLVYSFLLTKRNLKGAKKIHKEQCRKNKLTLGYIREYAVYTKEYQFFQRSWIVHISLIVPQYFSIVLLNLFSMFYAMILMLVFFVTKLVFYAVFVRTQFHGRISRFDKRD